MAQQSPVGRSLLIIEASRSHTHTHTHTLTLTHTHTHIHTHTPQYDSITRRMPITCWITKATDTHPEYVILTPFSRQQWFRECASVLRL
jgi:hypothetical protein